MRRPGHTEPLFLYDAHIQRQDLASFSLGHLCEACGLRLCVFYHTRERGQQSVQPTS